MAEDVSVLDKSETLQRQFVTNVSESTANLLLQSVKEEWRKNISSYETPGHLMRECLTKAGLSFHGREALQMHTVILSEIMTGNAAIPTNAGESFVLTAMDYFALLHDERLGWLSFWTEILPYLRMSKANKLLACLANYCNIRLGETSDVSCVKLALSALILINKIILDFLAADAGQKSELQLSPIASLHNFSDKYRQLEMDVQTLCYHKKTFLEMLLQLISVSHVELDVFRQLLGCLSLCALVLSPFDSAADTENILQKLYVGQITIPEVDERGDKKRHVKTSDKWQERCRLDDEFEMMEITSLEHKKVTDSTVSSEAEATQSTSASSICTFRYLAKCLKSHTTVKLYSELIRFFCRGDVKDNHSFYLTFSDLIVTAEDICIGCHVLSGQKLYIDLLKHLQGIISGSAVLAEDFKNCVDFSKFLQHGNFSLPAELLDIDRMKMTETDLILESGRELGGRDDLRLLKNAVKNQEKGWRKLLALGLKNTDVNEWWKAGFFDLVWNYETSLSSEVNVKQLLQVLCTASSDDKISSDTESMTKLNQLFVTMFGRLPTLLQEQIVLSVLGAQSDRGDPPKNDSFENGGGSDSNNLKGFLSHEDIVGELTPLLNKLTLDSVDRLMTHILRLCLYEVNTVMYQIVQVAIENKGQIRPVVEVFRQMPNICGLQENAAKTPKLVHHINEVLKDMVVTEDKANNIMQFFSLLAEAYILVIDPSAQSTQEMVGLLSVGQMFKYFILPSLDAGVPSPTDQKREATPKSHENSNDQHIWKQRGEEELAEDSQKRNTVLATESKESEHAVGTEVLPLHLALSVLSACVEKINVFELNVLKPFPLLALLADIYNQNYTVFFDGEVDKGRLAVKQVAQKNICLLSTVVLKHCKLFSVSHFLWLKQQALAHGWLHTALLKPILNIGCDLQLQNGIMSVARQMTSEPEPHIRELVLLIQLGLVNDEMFNDVKHVIKQVKVTGSQSCLLAIVIHFLVMSVTTEMYRLVDLLKTLLFNCAQSFSKQVTGVQAKDTELALLEQASQLFCDGMLVLSSEQMTGVSLCYVIANYQAAVQSLLEKTKQASLLASVLCQHAMLLSHCGSQAAQILQVSAMDIFTRLTAVVSSSKRNTKSAVTERGGGEIEDENWQANLLRMESHIQCITKDGIRRVLKKQLENLR